MLNNCLDNFEKKQKEIEDEIDDLSRFSKKFHNVFLKEGSQLAKSLRKILGRSFVDLEIND